MREKTDRMKKRLYFLDKLQFWKRMNLVEGLMEINTNDVVVKLKINVQDENPSVESERKKINQFVDSCEKKRLEKLSLESYREGKYINYKQLIGYDIDYNSVSLLAWFKEKWLDNNDKDKEKIRFYLWFESVYYDSISNWQRNKKKHFRQHKSKSLLNSIFSSGSTVGKIVCGLLSVAAGSGLATTILGEIKVLLSESMDSFSFQRVLFWGTIVFLTGGMVYCLLVSLLAQIKYINDLIKIDKSRETWIRHQNTVFNYQMEIFKYLYNLDDYRLLDIADKDHLFIASILNIWGRNNNQFSINMGKNDE